MLAALRFGPTSPHLSCVCVIADGLWDVMTDTSVGNALTINKNKKQALLRRGVRIVLVSMSWPAARWVMFCCDCVSRLRPRPLLYYRCSREIVKATSSLVSTHSTTAPCGPPPKPRALCRAGRPGVRTKLRQDAGRHVPRLRQRRQRHRGGRSALVTSNKSSSRGCISRSSSSSTTTPPPRPFTRSVVGINTGDPRHVMTAAPAPRDLQVT